MANLCNKRRTNLLGRWKQGKTNTKAVSIDRSTKLSCTVMSTFKELTQEIFFGVQDSYKRTGQITRFLPLSFTIGSALATIPSSSAVINSLGAAWMPGFNMLYLYLYLYLLHLNRLSEGGGGIS